MSIVEIEAALALMKQGDHGEVISVLEPLMSNQWIPSIPVADALTAYTLLAQAYEVEGRVEEAEATWAQVRYLADDLEEVVAEPLAQQPGSATKPEEPVQEGVILHAKDLVKRYKKRTVVHGVELLVRQGEIVGLLGPNGAGKTTTFYMIVGLIRPDAGRVYLGDEDITRRAMYQRARRGIGYLAQEASIFSKLSVEDNLHAVLEFQPFTKAQRHERVEELIEEFRLEKVRRSKGYMLSGGERRRTEIARALASRPRFFLLDEPFAGVDPIAVEDIQAIVSGLKSRGIGVLITDHNVHETLAITDRAYLLYEGNILKQGTAEALASDEEVRKRYLGEKFTLERYQ